MQHREGSMKVTFSDVFERHWEFELKSAKIRSRALARRVQERHTKSKFFEPLFHAMSNIITLKSGIGVEANSERKKMSS